MCSPTLALVTGATLQGAAGFAGAQAQAGSLEFQAKQAENEARFADIQAEQTEQAGAIERTQLLQATSQAVAANVSATAGAGVDVGGATAREVFESTERVGIADVIQSQINTKRQVWGLRAGAAAKRAESKQLKKSAKLTRQLAPIMFAAPVLTGFSQANIASKKGAK